MSQEQLVDAWDAAYRNRDDRAMRILGFMLASVLRGYINRPRSKPGDGND